MKTVLLLVLATYCMGLGACMSSRNDGAGDLYKIIQHCDKGNC